MGSEDSSMCCVWGVWGTQVRKGSGPRGPDPGGEAGVALLLASSHLPCLVCDAY